MELVKQIVEVCVVPLLGVITAFLVNLLKTKTQELKEKYHNEIVDKYLSILQEAIEESVVFVNQTYVEALKKEDAFTKDAQEEAFNKAYSNVMNILTDEAKQILQIAIGDFNTYVTSKIEAAVNDCKR